jgi:REP element-mobilizing transposase RayT
MARPLRIYLPGAWYHVTARGNELRDIVRDDADREGFLARLGSMTERYRASLYAYVLMDNHFHLLLEPSEDNLSRAMQWLNVSYSQWFNRRHQRSGHLFQGRYKAIVVDWQQWGLELSRYVHLNPVRTRRQQLSKAARARHQAGVGKAVGRSVAQSRLKALECWRWSSYPAYTGVAPTPSWLNCEPVLRFMGGKGGGRRKAYRQYVERAVLEGAEESPWEQVQGQTVLGDPAYVGQMQEALRGDGKEQAGLKQLQRRPRWEEVIRVVEELKGERWEEFRDRRGDWGRDVALWLGRMACGLRLRELAEVAELGHYGSVWTALRHLEQRQAADPGLARLLSSAQHKLENK